MVSNQVMTDLRSVTPDQPAPSPDGSPPHVSKGDRHAGYRPTRQGRSADSERRLLEAAESLLRENGYTHTKVSEIIRVSGVSTGSFYHRFGDKAGLMEVLIERFIQDATAQIAALDISRKTHGNLAAMLTLVASNIYETMDNRLGVYRLVDELSKTDMGPWTRFHSLGEDVFRRVYQGMPAYRGEFSVPDDELETATRNVVQMLIVVILQTRLGAASMFPGDRKALIGMLVQASMGILRPKE